MTKPSPDPSPLPARAATPAVNDRESPLAWLRSRRGPGGRPLISDAQFLAGERLRADFERAMMGRRITTNWDMAGAGGRGSAGPAEPSDAAIAARERYQRALASVGPELGGILEKVCCLSSGLEQAERALGLPQRSGKAVLGLALTALARHYGMLAGTERRPVSAWGLPDARPSLAPRQAEEA